MRRLSPRRFEGVLRWLVRWYLNRREWSVDSHTPPEGLRIILALDALLLRGVSPQMVIGEVDAPPDLSTFFANVLRHDDWVMILNDGLETLDHALIEKFCSSVQYADVDSVDEQSSTKFDVIVLSDDGENTREVMVRLQQLAEQLGPRAFLLHMPRYDHEQERVLLHDMGALSAGVAKVDLQIDSQLFTWDAVWTAFVLASEAESTSKVA